MKDLVLYDLLFKVLRSYLYNTYTQQDIISLILPLWKDIFEYLTMLDYFTSIKCNGNKAIE